MACRSTGWSRRLASRKRCGSSTPSSHSFGGIPLSAFAGCRTPSQVATRRGSFFQFLGVDPVGLRPLASLQYLRGARQGAEFSLGETGRTNRIVRKCCKAAVGSEENAIGADKVSGPLCLCNDFLQRLDNLCFGIDEPDANASVRGKLFQRLDLAGARRAELQ